MTATASETAPGGETWTKRPARRVGTVTLGLTLVTAGVLMLISLFWPEANLRGVVKLSPLILVSLGVEALLSARSGGAVKYDWVGMLLCFILTIAAMGLYSAAWWFTYYGPEYGYQDTLDGGCYDGSVSGDESSLYLDYASFHGEQYRVLELTGGDVLQLELVNDRGNVNVQLLQAADGETLFDSEALADGVYTIEIPESGAYELRVTGNHAAGSLALQRVQTASGQTETR